MLLVIDNYTIWQLATIATLIRSSNHHQARAKLHLAKCIKQEKLSTVTLPKINADVSKIIDDTRDKRLRPLNRVLRRF